jgi:hypothetical protein
VIVDHLQDLWAHGPSVAGNVAKKRHVDPIINTVLMLPTSIPPTALNDSEVTENWMEVNKYHSVGSLEANLHCGGVVAIDNPPIGSHDLFLTCREFGRFLRFPMAIVVDAV